MNRHRKVLQCRCIGCDATIAPVAPHAPTRGLCAACQARSPGSWRIIYDREKRIGRIPRNLNLGD